MLLSGLIVQNATDKSKQKELLDKNHSNTYFKHQENKSQKWLVDPLSAMIYKGYKMKNGMKKKVLKHIKEDTHEFKEQLADDKKLMKTLKKEKKGKK